MKIDICKSRDLYYTQLNNEIDPYSACQVTSMLGGLDIGGYDLSVLDKISGTEQFKQREDKLRYFMLHDKGIQMFWKSSHGITPIPAPEWADCMTYAINQIYGKPITYFDPTISKDKIIADLKNKLPIYTSMKYPDNFNAAGNKSPIDGHIVLIVGIDSEEGYIINDPYKNHLTGKKDGYKNIYSYDDFKAHNKGYAIRYRRG
jgi:hypothetical protein